MAYVEDKCPKCGSALEYDVVDIGVGTLRGNPGCPECHWTPEKTKLDDEHEGGMSDPKPVVWDGVTRVEVIGEGGRLFTRWNCGHVTLALQDEGRTLKVFVDKPLVLSQSAAAVREDVASSLNPQRAHESSSSSFLRTSDGVSGPQETKELATRVDGVPGREHGDLSQSDHGVIPTLREVQLGVIEFHSERVNPGLIQRFYAVRDDLTAAGAIVDLWLMDIATVLGEFGYTMTVTTDKPLPKRSHESRSPDGDGQGMVSPTDSRDQAHPHLRDGGRTDGGESLGVGSGLHGSAHVHQIAGSEPADALHLTALSTAFTALVEKWEKEAKHWERFGDDKDALTFEVQRKCAEEVKALLTSLGRSDVEP